MRPLRVKFARAALAALAITASTTIMASIVASPAAAETAARADQGETTERCEISRDGTLLTARIVRTPLRKVAVGLARATGAQLTWLDAPADDPITVSFDRLELNEAIARILRQRTYVLELRTTASGSQLARISIGFAADLPEQVSLKTKLGSAMATRPVAIPRASDASPPVRDPALISDDELEQALGNPLSFAPELSQLVARDPGELLAHRSKVNRGE